MHWLAGDESRRASLLDAVDRLRRDDGVRWLRAREGRRRLARVTLADGTPVFAKHYLRPTRHPVREWWKRRLHLTAAEREWRTLVRLHGAGIPVPGPLAHVRLGSGEAVVLTAWIDGAPLGDALPADASARRRLLADAGALVRGLHEAGWAHRDLHRENLFVADGGLFLIDLQAARRPASARARLADLGRLDFSLRRALSLPDRVRLRAAALGATRPFDAATRAALRDVGRASLARGRIHARSRAGRSLREGRLHRRFEVVGMRGLVARSADETAVRAALAAPGGSDAIEVRRYADGPTSLLGRSAARRAWWIAHALEASDVPCPRVLAWVARRGWRGESRIALAREPDAGVPTSAMRDALDAHLAEAGFEADLAPDGAFVREGRAGVAALERLRFAGGPR